MIVEKIKKTLLGLVSVAVLSLGFCSAMASPALAVDCDPIEGGNPLDNIGSGVDCVNPDDSQTTLMDYVQQIINVVLFVISAVAVIIIVYGGVQYVLSTGDAAKVKNAKNTILYAVIGLVVAILAFAIVNFVITAIRNGEQDGTGSNAGNNGGQSTVSPRNPEMGSQEYYSRIWDQGDSVSASYPNCRPYSQGGQSPNREQWLDCQVYEYQNEHGGRN